MISPTGGSSQIRQVTYGYVDSGGLGGEVPNTYLPEDIKNLDILPVGSIIKIYTFDEQTLLYQTTITEENQTGATATFIQKHRSGLREHRHGTVPVRSLVLQVRDLGHRRRGVELPAVVVTHGRNGAPAAEVPTECRVGHR